MADRRAADRRVGARGRRPAPLRRPARGARRRPTTCSRATAGGGGGRDAHRRRDRARARRAAPRGGRRAGRRPHAHRRPWSCADDHEPRRRGSPTPSRACRTTARAARSWRCGRRRAGDVDVRTTERLLPRRRCRRAARSSAPRSSASTGRRDGDALPSMAAQPAAARPAGVRAVAATSPTSTGRCSAPAHARDAARDRLDAVPGHARRARRADRRRTARSSPTWPGRRSPAGARWSRRALRHARPPRALPQLEHVAIDYVRGSDAQARLLARLAGRRHRRDAVVDDRDRSSAHDMRAGLARRTSTSTAAAQRYTVDRPQQGMAVIDAPGARHAAARAARAAVRGT